MMVDTQSTDSDLTGFPECAAIRKSAAHSGSPRMKHLNIREMRANIGRLDELVASEGELIITRHGEAIARVLPMPQHRQWPDHAELRGRMKPLKTSSAELIRAERDER
jgi:antitoxin (DNA-binding transcriptional repressor) of toxin-antitoxin stability system